MSSKNIVLAIGLAGIMTGQTTVAQEGKKPAVLFVGSHGGRCAHEMANHLARAGFVLNHLAYPGLAANPLTWNEVKKYNVLVVNGLGKSNADMSLSDKNKQTLAVLNQFLQAGGGVLMLGDFGQQATVKPPQDAFLKPLGLTPLFDELTVAPADSEVGTAWNIPFAYTTNLPESPIKKGIRGIWVPVPEHRIGAQNHLISFVCDAHWTIALKGGKKTFTRKGPLQDVSPKGPGTYTTEVPLAALRSVGPGRVIYFGITPEYLFGANAYTTLEGIVPQRGLIGKPSDGTRLIVSMLNWLATPSLAADVLGGAKMNQKILQNPNKIQYCGPFNWSKKQTFPAAPLPYPGIIGAKTTYSSGTADVNAWIRAAEQENLAFVVFLEDFSKLTKEKFAALKKECKKRSTPSLALIPGFVIDDEVGNHYFYFGTAFSYPDRQFLSEDGKVFASDDPELDPENPKQKGQLAMTTLNYAYTKNSFKQTCGNFLFSKDAAPFANFFSNWDAVGVVTSKNGKLIEDATQDYLQLVDFGQGPLPLAITLLDSPAQLKKTVWRTVLCLPAKGGKTVDGVSLKAGSRIQDYFNLWHFYPDNPVAIYASNGPEIAYWGYRGPRDYEGSNKGNFVWQNYRWQLKGVVKSSVGLKELAIYDGPNLFRRFLPTNQKSFSFVLDLTHDKQHNLVLIVTDKNGKRAISGEHWDRNHRLEEFNCADRNNQLAYGLIQRADQTGILLGGNQTLASPNKRIDPKNVSPSGTFRNDRILGVPAFDGGAGGEPVVYAPVMMRQKGTDVYSPAVSESFRLFATGDVNVGEGRWERNFTDKIRVGNVWHTLWKTQPARDFTVIKRNFFFEPDPNSPLAVFMWKIKITLKKECPDNDFLVAILAPRKARVWAMRGSNGSVLAGNWETTRQSKGRQLTLPFDPGAYAACLDSGLGGAAVFSLTPGLTMQTTLPGKDRITFTLPKANAPEKKGESKTVRLLLVGIPRMTATTKNLPSVTNEVVERFRADFGLAGAPSYQLDPQAGTVTNTQYILTLDGSREKCFSGKITGTLISSLPVCVSGLNEQSSAFLYDYETKKARPIGIFEGKAWATIVLNGARNLFIGQPIVADQNVSLQLTQAAAGKWELEIHNPSAKSIQTRIHINPFFAPLKGIKAMDLSLPPGASIHRTLSHDAR